MNASPPPAVLGLFEKRVEGDDALLQLARLRFQQAGLGAEMHAGTPEHLDWVMQFRPAPDGSVTVHLPRDFNLPDENCRECILDLASRFAGRVRGMILHDHLDMGSRPATFVEAARALDSRLRQIQRAPILFVEYAAGLEPRVFVRFFDAIRDLPTISACIDTGHVGIWQARTTYAALRPGEDVSALKKTPDQVPKVLPELEKATASALPLVVWLVEKLGALGKPLHFHLHDGHPLSTFSPFGVSDHLSFLSEIPIAFEYHSRRFLPTMFGPSGLAQICRTSVELLGAEHVTFTLEIHPTFERRALGDAEQLFRHWRDKTNAERMNHWLFVLQQNQQLLLKGFVL